MSLLKQLRSKLSLQTGLTIGVATAIAATLLIILDPVLLILLAPASIFTLILSIQLAESRLRLNRMEQRIIDSKPEEQLNHLRHIDSRARKTFPTINNIAGSVGRMAPTVREILAKTSVSAINANVAATRPSVDAPILGMTTSRNTDIEFPPAPKPTISPTFENVRVAVIADEFTHQAFAYEWDTIALTPSNWQSEIADFKPHIVLIESAWEANGGLWRYHLTGPSAPRPTVVSLADYCDANDIPTVFWNKEDPPHFEDFLPTAALFDYVFTTDGNLISEYCMRLGHNSVGLLPFAAQPKIHNPGRIGRLGRDFEVVFGGMYFRHKYPERREQMGVLLPAAANFELDIFSRQSGENPDYQFPEPYNEYVRGSLPYSQMISAYHRYKVVLNVNSVIDSPTMCARRLFEATACGAAVVSASSPAISRYFPNDMLTTVESTDEAYHNIRSLLRSDELRDRKVHLAQRHIWETATYTDRASTIMSAVGVPHERPHTAPSFVVSTNRPEHLDTLFANVGRQETNDKQLVLLTHGFEITSKQIADLKAKSGIEEFRILSTPNSVSLGSNLNMLFEAADGEIILRMDDDDYYGPNYTRDLIHALDFSGAQLAGKAESYIYFEDSDSTILSYIGHSHRETNFIRGATFCGRREVFKEIKFPESKSSEDSGFLSQLQAAGGNIYAADRFNFMVMRRSDKSGHTWRVPDPTLFGSGEMKFVGCDPRQVNL